MLSNTINYDFERIALSSSSSPDEKLFIMGFYHNTRSCGNGLEQLLISMLFYSSMVEAESFSICYTDPDSGSERSSDGNPIITSCFWRLVNSTSYGSNSNLLEKQSRYYSLSDENYRARSLSLASWLTKISDLHIPEAVISTAI